MKVMKFTGSTMQEVMIQIRSELGPDAVILHSKSVQTPTYFGLFRKKTIEVIAAIDQEEKPARIMEAEKKPEGPSRFIKSEESATAKQILRELHQVTGLLKENAPKSESPSKYDLYPEELRNMFCLLRNLGLNSVVLDDIMQCLLKEWKRQFAIKELTAADLERLARKHLKDRLDAANLSADEPTRKYIAVMGPTGVGKTTTIAKIAADYMLRKRKRVAFITTDTYRIAAIEQLRTYAQILGVPMEVAYNLVDFVQAAERFAHYDHVFIDTAGRNFRNPVYVEELKKMLDNNLNLETYLVLAATAKEEDMAKIYEQFEMMAVDGLIFTKTDETENLGGMINFIMNHSIPVAYLADGQDVPDDLQLAAPEIIINKVFGGKEHVGSSRSASKQIRRA